VPEGCRETTHDVVVSGNTHTGTLMQECVDWEINSYSVAFENNRVIDALPGALGRVVPGADPAPQLGETVLEHITIDSAIAGRAAGETVEIPVFGRKAIGGDSGPWSTVVYDLNCRYVPLAVADREVMEALRAAVPQYAVARPVFLTVVLTLVDEYEVAARAVAVNDARRAPAPGRPRWGSVRSDGQTIYVRLDRKGPYTCTVIGLDGRRVDRFTAPGPGEYPVRRESHARGAFILDITWRDRNWKRKACVVK
jgi:hypothetical protein